MILSANISLAREEGAVPTRRECLGFPSSTTDALSTCLLFPQETDADDGPSPAKHRDRAPSFRDFHRALGRLGYNFTKGLFSRENLTPALLATGGALVAAAFDDEVSDALRDSSEAWGDAGQVLGGRYVVVGSTAVFLALTPFVENQRFRAFTFSLAQSVALNNALSFALKLTVDRTRPDATNDNSFPSAHASNAFAWASVAGSYYGWKVGVPSYAVAGFIALSRVERGSHWLSDAVAGSAIGLICGITAVHGSDHFAEQRWSILPDLARNHVGIRLYVSF